MSGSRTIVSRMAWCALLLINAAATRGQGKPDRITAWDDFNIQLAMDPQISPDGKEIVYVREFADVMTDQRYTNLWIVSADGTRHRALTNGNRHDGSPRW